MSDLHEEDTLTPIAFTYRDVTLLHSTRSNHQLIEVYEHPYFGRLLTLDRVVQFTQRDEHYYHEMLVQPAMHVHPCPQNILIIGGGDGGSVREVLRHQTVHSIVLVDIDEMVSEIAAAWFPEMKPGLVNRRVQRIAQSGEQFLAKANHQFDVIIVDSTDPIGPAAELFTSNFFRLVAQRLTTDGILSVQSESLHFHAQFVSSVQQRLARHFPIVDCVTQSLATYAGSWWTFSIGSKTHDVRTIIKKPVDGLRYYDKDVHHSALLPPSILAKVRDGTFNSWSQR